jgi:hypothetical protein
MFSPLSLRGCDEDLEVGRIVASGPLVADAGRHRGLPLRGLRNLRRGGPPWPPSPSPTGEQDAPPTLRSQARRKAPWQSTPRFCNADAQARERQASGGADGKDIPTNERRRIAASLRASLVTRVGRLLVTMEVLERAHCYGRAFRCGRQAQGPAPMWSS